MATGVGDAIRRMSTAALGGGNAGVDHRDMQYTHQVRDRNGNIVSSIQQTWDQTSPRLKALVEQGRANSDARDAYQTKVAANPNGFGSVAKYQPYDAARDEMMVKKMMLADAIGGIGGQAMTPEQYYYHMGSKNQEAERAASPTWQKIKADQEAIFGPRSTSAPAIGGTPPKPPTLPTPGAGGAGTNPTVPTNPTTPTTPTAPGGGFGGANPALNSESVVDQFNRVTASGSPLISMAEQAGMNAAHRRGLVNSSIAAGSARAEAYRAALPIAQQEAQTAFSRNNAAADRAAEMARLEKSLAHATDSQKRDIQAQMERLEQQGRITGGLQSQDAAAQMERLRVSLDSDLQKLDRQIASAEGQQKADLIAQRERLELNGRLEIERLSTAAGYDRQRIELQGTVDRATQAASSEQQRALVSLQGEISSRLQAQQDVALFQRQAAQFAQNVQLQDQENAAQLQRIAAAGDQDLRRVLAAAQEERQNLAMNIAAGDRERIAASMINVFQAEAQMRASLLSNQNMPAAERSAYEQAISSLGNPVRQFINQLYGGSAPQGSGFGAVTQPAGGSGGGFGSVNPNLGLADR